MFDYTGYLVFGCEDYMRWNRIHRLHVAIDVKLIQYTVTRESVAHYIADSATVRISPHTFPEGIMVCVSEVLPTRSRQSMPH